MTHMHRRFAGILIAAVILTGCDAPGSNSLFEEDVTFAPDPTITAMNPATQFFAGFQTITITGTNFSATASDNTVWFNNVKATVVSASPTQIVVNTPNLVADSIGVKVAVKGAIGFSNNIKYKLEALFEDATSLPPNTLPVGAAIDGTGRFYIALIGATQLNPLGVGQFNATNAINPTYVPDKGWTYRTMKIGPDGGLYMLRVAGGVPFLYRSPAGGGATTNWASSLGRAEDLDFDAQGFVWVVGSNETNTLAKQDSIFRVQDLGASRARVGFPFVANGTAVKVYDGHLYVGGTRGGVPKIWRFPINGDNTLGAEEEWIDLTSYSSQAVPRSIAFATDGTMFVAVNTTTDTQPLLAISPSKQISEYYPDIIPGTILKMHWVKGTQRVLMTLIDPETGNTTRVITMNMQKDGAPFHGIE